MSENKAEALFRPKALSRYTSPEQLDHLITVTTPMGWVALGMIGAVLLYALIWGIVGSVPTTIQGKGILLRGGRITQVVAPAAGQVAALSARMGDEIAVGQQVGTILQPVKQAQVQGQEVIVAGLQTNYDQVARDQAEALDKQLAYYTGQRTNLMTSIAAYQDQAASLDRIVKAQEALLAQGLITEVNLLQTRNQYYQAQLNLLDAQNNLAQNTSQATAARNQAQQATFTAQSSLVQAQETLAQYRADLEQTSRLLSAFAGRVVDVAVFEGQAMQAGAPVVVLEVPDDRMQAVLYFKPGDGKKAHPGMRAHISPGTAEVEEFGFMLGDVTYVSDVPASSFSIEALLQNDDMVKGLMGDEGAPIRIMADLRTSPDNPSGFEWSSSKGPKIRITPGTVCSAQVVIRSQPPITLVVPFLRKFFGVID